MISRQLIFTIILLLTFFRYLKTESEGKSEIFIYPGKAESESGLPTCESHEVCSIVHKRFWFPRQIERFCRCAINECPSSWLDESDNYTMSLNNRAQMKFCDSIKTLPTCAENQTHHLQVSNFTNLEKNRIADNFRITSKAQCYCPPHHKWVPKELQQNGSTQTSTSYRCAPLHKCNANDFCGFERADHYSIYYHCSCPEGHLCVRPNKSIIEIKEVFFNGNAYRAHCTAFPPILNTLLNND